MVFVDWKLKLLNFLVDSVLSSFVYSVSSKSFLLDTVVMFSDRTNKQGLDLLIRMLTHERFDKSAFHSFINLWYD